MEITSFGQGDISRVDAFLKANRKEKKKDVEIQFFDAGIVASWEHLFFATLNALQAFRNGTNISKSVAMEVMLYASALRQIKKAIQRCGIKPNTEDIAVIVIGKNQRLLDAMLRSMTIEFGRKPNDAVLDLTESKILKIKQTFEISDEELASVRQLDDKKALVDIIIERTALLSTQL